MATPAKGVTALLAAVENGDEGAMHRLVPLVYDELRRLAKHHLAGQRAGHTLQTSDLVSEAYLPRPCKRSGVEGSRAFLRRRLARNAVGTRRLCAPTRLREARREPCQGVAQRRGPSLRHDER